ncbi:MAG: cofactor-independent phosphoglycerate mutase, partial [Candidatus Altiarchaeota archaeon]|nr:cofactor-independent phosphoglycerate mutase [Candidatus Altiarchaeota archaeon]
MKYIILVPDGMADHPVKSLGDKTPCEAADTPNMDYLAKNSLTGMAQTFFEGLPYDSSIANTAIMGYDPRKYFCGRSPLEAANLGIELGIGDISLRCNLVTVKDGRMSDFTAGHITSDESKQIFKTLSDMLGSEGVEFYPGVSYRNILVLRKNTKPDLDFKAHQPHDIVGEEIAKYVTEATSNSGGATAELLNRLTVKAHDILLKHPVNERRLRDGLNPATDIWLWGAGDRPGMPSFKKMYGIDGSLVSAVDLLNGLAKVIGLRVLKVAGVTGYLDTNYEGKADAALESLDEVDLTYIHIESTDESGHEGNIEHKLKAIEDIDKRVVGRILDKIEGDYRIVMIPDHPTPVEIKKHTNEP